MTGSRISSPRPTDAEIGAIAEWIDRELRGPTGQLPLDETIVGPAHGLPQEEEHRVAAALERLRAKRDRIGRDGERS